MLNKRILLLFTHILLAAVFAYLAIIYFRYGYWHSFYGNILHQFGRAHIVFVHFSVGSLLLLAAAEAFCSFFPDYAKATLTARVQFQHLCHFLTVLTLISGLLMELVERYPNPLIRQHIIGGIAVYACLIALIVVNRWGTRLKKWRSLAAVALIFAVLNASNIGGTIYKGSQFFTLN